MKTVRQVAELTGVSVRTLQYYDEIGLLRPAKRTEAGYRLYAGADLERLQQILLLRSLEFKLKDIRAILDSPSFDRAQALKDQIALLTLRKEHLENLIVLARDMQKKGVKYLNFTAFDTKKLDEYSAQAKARWGKTKEYAEFEERDEGRTEKDRQQLTSEMMDIFVSLGRLRGGAPDSPQARQLVAQLQQFITGHFYPCTEPILLSLGLLYAGGGEMTQNIDRCAGEGTGEFACRAIQAYCGK